jgi:uncharacterized protein YjbI with pentapeptide repeats
MQKLSQEQLDEIILNDGNQCDLSNKDARNLEFNGADLSQADLRFSDFSGSNMEGCILPDDEMKKGSQF